jgi:hypothetical protein
VDDQLDATKNSTALIADSNPLMIGRNSEEPSRDWKGLIDDVRFYNKDLTDSEILDIYISGLYTPSDVPLLLGWWKFDQAAQGVTPDSSGNGRNGVLAGDCQIVNDTERGSVLQINSTNNSWVNCGGGGIGGWANQQTFSITA